MNKMFFRIIVILAIAAVSNAAGLIGHWPFDGNSNDVSGNGHHGIVHGSPGYVNGKMGQALELDGLVDGIELPDESAFDNLDDADGTTISFWFKIPEGQVSNGAILCKYLFNETYPEGGGWGFVTYTDDWENKGVDGNISFIEHRTDNSWAGLRPGKYEYHNDGKWHHFVGVIIKLASAEHNIFLFMDSEPSGFYEAGAYNPHENDEPVTIGYSSSYESGKHWKGLIDDVRIYDYALSEAEVDTLFRNSGGTICTSEITGDLDFNCQVDMVDFALIAKDWLECSNFYAEDCFQ